MLIHRDDVHERRYVVNIDHLYEANKFLIPIRANKITSIQIRREFSPYRVKIFPEMPEKSSVSYTYLIINLVDAFYKIVIKRYNFHDHATLGGTPDILPGHLRQIFPPILKASCRYCSPVVPFPVIIIFCCDLRRLLRKRKDIGL